MILCGLDVGGSGTKCSVFCDDGRCIAFSRCEYDMIFENGKYEIDAKVIWNAVKKVLTEVAAKTGGIIDAIAVSALGEAGVPLSSDNQILAPSILFHDPRGCEEAAKLKSFLGNKKIYEKVGSVANGSFTIEKLAWIKNNEKYYKKIEKFLPMEAFIINQLSGEMGLGYSSAARTLAFNIKNMCWDEEILDILELNSELLPSVYQSGTIIGNMKKDVANELGIKSDVRILTGGHDMWCCTVGCGVLNNSVVANVAGGCESLNYVRTSFDSSDYMMKHNYYWTPFVTDEAYGTYCVCLSAGSILKWMKQCFFSNWDNEHNGSFYKYMDNLVGNKPSSIVVVPYFSTAGSPNFSTNANGLIDGLKLNTSSSDIYRGIMEGITYSLKENVDILSLAGYSTGVIRSTGGGANSAIWSQIKADILSTQIEIVSGNEAGTVGAAIMAGVGMKAFTSYKEAQDVLVKISAVYTPSCQYKDLYEQNYQRFLELRRLLFSSNNVNN